MRRLLIIAIVILSLFAVGCFGQGSKLYPVTAVENNKLGYKFINKKTEDVLASFDDVLLNFDGDHSKDYAIVVKDGNIEIINKKGDSLVDVKFDNVAEIYGDRAILIRDGKNTLYDLKNKVEILTHDYIKSESNGIFAFMEDGKWGYRTEKEIVAEPMYDEAYSFGKEFAVATKDGASYKIKKDGTSTSLPYSEVVKASDSEYLLAKREDSLNLLNQDGDEIFKDIKGDIVDVNYDMLSILTRNGGKIQNAIYSVNGKEIQPPIYDDVRLLSKKFFSARNKDGFALFNIDGTQLTGYKYSYLSADGFDKNGGVICAIIGEEPEFLDKNGKKLDGPEVAGAVDVSKDENFYIIKTNENTFYFDKDKNLKYTSPNATRLENVLAIIAGYPKYPMIFNDRLNPNANQNLKAAVDELTDLADRKIEMKIRGDILDITINNAEGEATFMYDISRAEVVRLKDIFKSADLEKAILYLTSFRNKDVTIVAFTLDDDLKITVKDGDKFENETIPYEKIEPFINKDGGTFFKAVLAPSVNVEHE